MHFRVWLRLCAHVFPDMYVCVSRPFPILLGSLICFGSVWWAGHEANYLLKGKSEPNEPHWATEVTGLIKHSVCITGYLTQDPTVHWIFTGLHTHTHTHTHTQTHRHTDTHTHTHTHTSCKQKTYGQSFFLMTADLMKQLGDICCVVFVFWVIRCSYSRIPIRAEFSLTTRLQNSIHSLFVNPFYTMKRWNMSRSSC